MMVKDLEVKFKAALEKFEKQFGGGLDMQAILYIIGVQELGKGPKKFSKKEKLDILHIAICTLLEPYGHYEFEGLDDDGWPHWSVVENLPPLKSGQQLYLMKQAVIEYCVANNL
jgi:hypothetical protein